jgi:hypothetical protein
VCVSVCVCVDFFKAELSVCKCVCVCVDLCVWIWNRRFWTLRRSKEKEKSVTLLLDYKTLSVKRRSS